MGQHTGPFDVVRIVDPAIDANAEIDWETYYRERDPKLLRYYPGREPVVFHCRPLTISERREVKVRRDAEGLSTPMSREMAFRLGLVRVLRLVREDGSARDWERPEDGGKKARAISEEALELFGDTTIEDVGGVIEARSFLDRDQPLVCPLLGISQLGQTHLRVHRAVLMRASSSSPPSRPEAEGQPPVTPPSSPAGGGSGGATATASPIADP